MRQCSRVKPASIGDMNKEKKDAGSEGRYSSESNFQADLSLFTHGVSLLCPWYATYGRNIWPGCECSTRIRPIVVYLIIEAFTLVISKSLVAIKLHSEH